MAAPAAKNMRREGFDSNFDGMIIFQKKSQTQIAGRPSGNA
jgi:hypothetical protein